VHVSIVWILWNWWLHDGLHMVNDSTSGLLAIEYAFHVTIMIAGAILAYAVVARAERRQLFRGWVDVLQLQCDGARRKTCGDGKRQDRNLLLHARSPTFRRLI
jgi:hypothetical protein